MLSSSGKNLYWLGRYLDRAEQLSRMLHLQMETLVDRPRQEISFGWRRIYANLQRRPPLGVAEFELYGDDDIALADAYTLADDLTFEASHPDSLHSCFAYGRENARQSRNYLSFELWTYLNRIWLQVKETNLADIWQPAPENFYTRLTQQLDACNGIAAATMYRDQGWHFLQLGRALERAQQTSALLLAQLKLTQAQGSENDWLSLLRFYQALDTYKWHYCVHIDPEQILRLLVHDRQLPRALAHAWHCAKMEVKALRQATGVKDRQLQQLGVKLDKELQGLQLDNAVSGLEQCHSHLCQFDQALTLLWFDYSIEDKSLAHV